MWIKKPNGFDSLPEEIQEILVKDIEASFEGRVEVMKKIYVV